MGILTFPPQEDISKNPTLTSQLGYLGHYPFTNEEDVRISAYTEWGDSVGYRKVGVLTIGAGQTLRITKSPFIIFAKEIIFESTTSVINANGWHGSEYTRYPTTTFARGGYIDGVGIANTTGGVFGGCGGGMLLIITERISGAAGAITANGGNGAIVSAFNHSSSISCSGQGALSNSYPAQTTGSGGGSDPSIDLSFSINPYTVTTNQDQLVRDTVNSSINYMGRAGFYLLGAGIPNVRGGASSNSANNTGGSGFGGGGTVNYGTSTGYTGEPTTGVVYPPISILVPLWGIGCRGGGGGAALQALTGGGGPSIGPAAACGGGGGLIHIWASTFDTMPSITANGGTATQRQVQPYPNMVGHAGAAGMTGITRI